MDLSWPLMTFFFLSIMQSTILNKSTLFLFILWLSVIHLREFLSIIKGLFQTYSLILILVWEMLSIGWSKVTLSSIIYVGNDIEVMIFCLLVAFHSKHKDVAKSLKLTCFFVIGIALVYCFMFPGDSISPIGLKSFYIHKNSLGYTMAICSLIILMSFKKSLLNYMFLFISILLLILSQSKTSQNLFLIVLFIFGIAFAFKHFYSHLTEYTKNTIKLLSKTIPSFLYAFIFTGVIYREDVATYLMNKIPDDAFTGRGLLWNTVLSRSFDHLLIGNGPGVFWGSDLLSEIAQTPLYQQPWIRELHAADGGYIDVIGSLGFVGLALVLVAIIQFYKLVFNAPKIKTVILSAGLTTFFVLHNFTETGFFRFVSVLWFLFQFFTFYLTFISEKNRSLNDKRTQSLITINS